MLAVRKSYWLKKIYMELSGESAQMAGVSVISCCVTNCPKNLNNQHLLSHSLYGSGTWKQLNLVVLARGPSGVCKAHVSRGCLIWRHNGARGAASRMAPHMAPVHMGPHGAAWASSLHGGRLPESRQKPHVFYDWSQKWPAITAVTWNWSRRPWYQAGGDCRKAMNLRRLGALETLPQQVNIALEISQDGNISCPMSLKN